MTRLKFHPAARAEYFAAIDYLEDAEPGLGARFTIEIEGVIARIADGPARWRLIEAGIRRCVARRFPYAVIYAAEGDEILVLAVAHASREPGYWRQRRDAVP